MVQVYFVPMIVLCVHGDVCPHTATVFVDGLFTMSWTTGTDSTTPGHDMSYTCSMYMYTEAINKHEIYSSAHDIA